MTPRSRLGANAVKRAAASRPRGGDDRAATKPNMTGPLANKSPKIAGETDRPTSARHALRRNERRSCNR